MYSKTSAASRTSRKSVMREDGAGGETDPRARRCASRMLQDDLHHDVARVATAVDGLLHHFEKLLQNHELLRLVGPVVEILQQREHHLVGLALRELQPIIGLANLLDRRAA